MNPSGGLSHDRGIGSAIQSTQSQRQAGESREVEELRNANANAKQVARNEEMDSTVETTDSDTQVNTDGGGQGSQGRQFAEESEEHDQAEEGSGKGGFTVDDDGQMHLDLEA